MFETIRRLVTAALVGGYLALAPSTMFFDVTRLPPAVVLGVGDPTPSVAVRPRA